MASEKLREAREWLTFAASLLTVIGIPVGLLVLRNQKLETLEQVRHEYVTKESFEANKSAQASELNSLKTTEASEIISLKAELSRLSAQIQVQTVQIVRLTDAVKLKDQPP